MKVKLIPIIAWLWAVPLIAAFPLIDRRGRVLLIVDKTLATALAADVTEYQADLDGDGWEVTVVNGPRHQDFKNKNTKNPSNSTYGENVAFIKEKLIRPFYLVAPTDVNVVVLLGHLMVPYSGIRGSDGHGDHAGAWPADIYYGDLTGLWKDDNSTALPDSSYPNGFGAFQNIAGDGWWSDNDLPTEPDGSKGRLEIAVGRIDFSGMRGFVGSPATVPTDSPGTKAAKNLAQTELRLIHNYLAKARRYRNKQIAVSGAEKPSYFNLINFRGLANVASLITNSFGWDGYTNRSLFGPVSTAPTLFGVHGGYGAWQGVYTDPDWKLAFPGSELAFPKGTLQRVPNAMFVNLWGSYFVDWQFIYNGVDEGRNGFSPLLKSLLAARDTCLTVSTFIPHVNLARFSQNYHFGAVVQDTLADQPNDYRTDDVRSTFCLGDPTLRAFVATPPSGVSATRLGNGIQITWTLASGLTAVLDRSVSLGSGKWSPWTRLTESPIATNSFEDTSAPRSVVKKYRVRALENVAVGAQAGPVLSQGRFTTIN